MCLKHSTGDWHEENGTGSVSISEVKFVSEWTRKKKASVIPYLQRDRFIAGAQRGQECEDGAEKDLRMLALKTGAMQPQTKE